MKHTILITLAMLTLAMPAMAQQVPPYVPVNGLQGWWPFTGNANDSSGNGHNGLVNGAILTTDRFGNPNCAYLFNGMNNNITTADTFFNVGWDSLSVSCWFKDSSVTNLNTDNYNNSMFNTLPLSGIEMNYNWGNDSSYHFFLGSNPPSGSWDIGHVTSKINGLIGTWHHMVLVKAGLQYSMYIDGLIDTSDTFTTNAINYNCQVIFGNIDPAYPSECFLGSLDDYGVWNRALTPQEVYILYTGIVPCQVTVYDTVYTAVTDTLIINANLTGIAPPHNTNTLKIYPNPTADHIIINTGNYASMVGYSLKITNMLSQTVYETAITQQTYDVSLATWGGDGTYIVEILNASSAVIDTRKIILQ